jgi:DNA-binding response OmpR family regulator
MDAHAGGTRPILVVEDDEDTVTALCMLLDDAGYASVSAGDVAGAIVLLGRADPGLVLLDWSLDDGSGEDVLIAARCGERRPPVVLVTGHSELGPCALPPDAVLRKPFDVEELLELVAHLYRR